MLALRVAANWNDRPDIKVADNRGVQKERFESGLAAVIESDATFDVDIHAGGPTTLSLKRP
jgi:hypothetical protein